MYSESSASDITLAGDQGYSPFESMADIQPPRPAKRQRLSDEDGSRPATTNTSINYNKSNLSKTESGASSNQTAVTSMAVAGKPKRVRTGCLTCRERHLKCDEGLPNCQNCRKSSRTCKRGIKLNFIDTQVQSPPMIPPTADWAVEFQDESREIASEYKGGLGRYALIDQTITPPHEPAREFPSRNITIDPNLTGADALPPIVHSRSATMYSDSGTLMKQEHSRENSRHHSHTNSDVSYLPTAPPTACGTLERALTPTNETRNFLSNPEEVFFMQLFVEEVGLWMDSMDSMNHFSRILPFSSLSEPMLLNAFLACGARHLTMVNSAYEENRALYYYDTATTQLLRALQNPDRDTAICATTAVILNVYEIMSERALQRMNHIAGARALIKECGWSARSTGIGAACFWLNVGMEFLSCLHFNWQVAWEPDQWGVDMDFSRELPDSGREELWVHRMLYICAKIANFRASIPRFQEPSPHDEQIRLQNRYAEWQRLKALCDSWDSSIPRSMHPMAYLHPYQSQIKSAFPEVWLIKRATIVGRLFYHTAMTLLPQINPLLSKDTPEMHEMQLHHSHQICGIVAHVKDRGVASVAIRSLDIAAEVLVDRREQEEVLRIFDRIRKETGWKIGFLHNELREKWGWPSEEQVTQQMMQQQNSLSQFFPSTTQSMNHSSQATSATSLPAPVPPVMREPLPRATGGILNPLLRTADFSLPNHPYQQYYQPPNQHNNPLPHNFY